MGVRSGPPVRVTGEAGGGQAVPGLRGGGAPWHPRHQGRGGAGPPDGNQQKTKGGCLMPRPEESGPRDKQPREKELFQQQRGGCQRNSKSREFSGSESEARVLPFASLLREVGQRPSLSSTLVLRLPEIPVKRSFQVSGGPSREHVCDNHVGCARLSRTPNAERRMRQDQCFPGPKPT